MKKTRKSNNNNNNKQFITFTFLCRKTYILLGNFVGEHIWKILIYIFGLLQSVSFSNWYLPAFGQNTERYGISLRTQSECGKIRTRKTRIRTLFTQCLYYSSFCFADYLKRSNEVLTSIQIYTGFADATLRPKILDNKLGILMQVLIAMDYYLLLGGTFYRPTFNLKKYNSICHEKFYKFYKVFSRSTNCVIFFQAMYISKMFLVFFAFTLVISLELQIRKGEQFREFTPTYELQQDTNWELKEYVTRYFIFH